MFKPFQCFLILVMITSVLSNKALAQKSNQSREMSQVNQLIKKEEYEDASIKLFDMASRPAFKNEHSTIRYLLGQVLGKIKFLQIAAFQYLYVIKNAAPSNLQKGLEKLSVVGDELDDYSLLNFAMKKVAVDAFPKTNRDMLYFRLGESYLAAENKEKAVEYFRKVGPGSKYFFQAKYQEGIALSELGNVPNALRAFSLIVDQKEESGDVTSSDRNAALLGLARAYYQAKRWDLAIDVYRQIPKDIDMWHDAVFEMSWAFLRAGDFRSVLSNLHTLHSTYYEDYFVPESILLRGIVYLSLCKNEEMEKTLSLMERIYEPVLASLNQVAGDIQDPVMAFDEIEKMINSFEELRGDKKARKKYQIPFVVARTIIRDGKFRQAYKYLQKLREERDRIKEMSAKWRRSSLGNYSDKILTGRILAAKKVAGSVIRARLEELKIQLQEHFDQANFARYELLNAKKDQLQSKVQGKSKSGRTDDSRDRSFFVQNGYEYWKFRGEYWLDEIGNYHYVGNSECQ